MNTKNKEQSKDDWFQKLDRPLKSVNIQYNRLFYKKRDLSKHQRILNEYDIANPKALSKSKKNNPLDEKIFLSRINIYNYKNLGRENNIMKNILSKIEECKEKRKKNHRNISLKLKKIKTHNDYDQIISNKNINCIHNYNKLQKSNLSSSIITPLITERNKGEQPLRLILNKNLNLNIENTNSDKSGLSSIKQNKNIYILDKDKVNNNRKEQENDNNFFQTLTRVDNYNNKGKKEKKYSKIENLCKMLEVIRDEENNGKIIKKDILYIKKNKRFDNNLNKSKPINLSINYSKIKSKKDIEENILNNNPKVLIFDYLKDNIKKNSLKRLKTQNSSDCNGNIILDDNNINQSKNSLILPICPTSHKG